MTFFNKLGSLAAKTKPDLNFNKLGAYAAKAKSDFKAGYEFEQRESANKEQGVTREINNI